MLLTITVASTEVEDFAIELLIEADATFADLHELIRSACGWGQSKPATFFVCDERWRKEREIPESSYEYDTMEEVELGDLLEDEGQRMLYVFDPDEERALLLEVSHISFGKSIDEPKCRRSRGTAPDLILEREQAVPTSTEDLLKQLNAAALGIDDDDEREADDDEGFDPEEFDPEGYTIDEG